jgi:hypothetical protein
MILPPPAAPFEWVATPAGPALVCRPLAAVATHLFTTRQWLLGSRTAGENDDRGWQEVARAVAIAPGDLMRARQVHAAAVAIGRHPPGSRPDADVLIARDPDIALAVQAADCVPLLMADRRTGAIGAAHAGWRGLAAGVPGAVVRALAHEFGSRVCDLIAALGPSIGACCYEVGGDVKERFVEAGFDSRAIERWFLASPAPTPLNPSMPGLGGQRTGRWFLDGWTATVDQLVEAGLPADQIFSSTLCTASHPGTLCSFRRDGPPAGRLAAVIRSATGRP